MLNMTLRQKQKLKECIRRGIIKDIYKRGLISDMQLRNMLMEDFDDA